VWVNVIKSDGGVGAGVGVGAGSSLCVVLRCAYICACLFFFLSLFYL
jgi:hypothetical protein